MADIEEIRKKVDQLITKGGFNYRDLSLKIGRKDSYIQQYVKYGYPRRLKEMDRIRLAKILNVDDTELMDDEIIATKANSIVAGKHNIISDIIHNSNLPESNLSVIEVMNPKPDNSAEFEQIISKNFVCKSMLDDLGINMPRNIKIVKITSDSMKPNINPGDYAWFDISCKIPESDGLYLFLNGKDLCIKRVEISPLDGSVEISGDNPNYKIYKANSRTAVKTFGKLVALTKKI